MTWADAFAVVGVAWAFAFMVYQGRRTEVGGSPRVVVISRFPEMG